MFVAVIIGAAVGIVDLLLSWSDIVVAAETHALLIAAVVAGALAHA